MARNDRKDAARRNTRMRFEQWAQNPSCEANTISAVRNVRMADVARVAGLPTTFGQSPFALIRGDQFERSLFRDNAQRLLEELIKRNVLSKGQKGFRDLRIRQNGGTEVQSLDESIERTRELIYLIPTASPKERSKLPVIVAGATVRIPKGVLLPEATLIIDVMAIRTDRDPPELVIGEIKTYPDRGGHTQGHELALARAQAGIYVHATDLVVAELGLKERLTVDRKGFLVLTWPGSNQPSVRAGEDLTYQAERAKRGFELLERAALALSKDLWATEETAPPTALIEAVLKADTHYCESCLSFCDLAPRCFEQARKASDPIVLGEHVRRFLGTVNLARAIELLDGEPASNEAERDLVQRIHESLRMMNA